MHISRTLARAIRNIGDKHRVEKGIAVAKKLIETLENAADLPAGLRGEYPHAEVLRAIVGMRVDGRKEEIRAPATPLLATTLLTNAHGEPRVGVQLESEVHSSDRIDALMAFIRRSGLRNMREALRRHCDAGRELRILTTTHTVRTQVEALEQLTDLGAHVKVPYDTTSSRLHAKWWLFHLNSGFSTAYVGSSNMTFSVQTPGLAARWSPWPRPPS